MGGISLPRDDKPHNICSQWQQISWVWRNRVQKNDHKHGQKFKKLNDFKEDMDKLLTVQESITQSLVKWEKSGQKYWIK